MKYTVEKSLSAFEFWSGAKETRERLTNEQMNQIESILEDSYPEGMTETQINDIFWFEQDWIAEMLGFRSWEDLIGIEEEEDPEEDEEE